MAKEFFKSLPDTSTPLSASRLNGLLNGNEAMGNIVVGDVKSKNLLNINATPHHTFYSSPTVEGDTLTTSGTSDNFLAFLIDVKPNTDYTLSVESMNSGIAVYDASVKTYIGKFNRPDGTTYTFNTGSYSQITIVFYGNDTYVKPQLEEGTAATEYTPYKAFGIESGSNSNGSWVKFEDGTMICYREINVTLACNETWGNLYFGRDTTEYTFAQSFIEAPKVYRDIMPTGSYSGWVGDYQAPTITKNSYKNFAFVRPSSADSVPVKVTLLAIGRWK